MPKDTVEELRGKLNKIYLRLAYGKSDIEKTKREVDEILTTAYNMGVEVGREDERFETREILSCIRKIAENSSISLDNYIVGQTPPLPDDKI